VCVCGGASGQGDTAAAAMEWRPSARDMLKKRHVQLGASTRQPTEINMLQGLKPRFHSPPQVFWLGNRFPKLQCSCMHVAIILA
jgi:hypothetical protein